MTEAVLQTIPTKDSEKLYTFYRSRDVDGWAGMGWNPVKGCRNTCNYCYAYFISKTRYPDKFEPRIFPERLIAPKITPIPKSERIRNMIRNRIVFTVSMGELFGPWVPDDWIEQVLDAIRKAPDYWIFALSTKYPQRLVGIDFPENVWIGTTVDKQFRVKAVEEAFQQVKATVKFVSCEPLLEPVVFNNIGLFDWLIIGAQSRFYQNQPPWQPEWAWCESLIKQARDANLKVFIRPNLKVGPHEKPKEYPDVQLPVMRNTTNYWRPREIIVHEEVRQDPVTTHVLQQCEGIPVKYVGSAKYGAIVGASSILSRNGNSILDKVSEGKQVLYIGPAMGREVDIFDIPDDRMMCPHFERLKLASNGCFYQCDWCYLKATYRGVRPYITIRAEYDKIKNQIQRRLNQSDTAIIFNSGEMADSLSMEHLTLAAQEFIPWFGRTENGYLFMLTKSDNVDGILDLNHNNHTIVAWSMNNEQVSRQFEIGAPPFENRLEAAHKVQNAGYPVRIRLDPIVPFPGWQGAYSETINRIFSRISPERVTIGTLRFEEAFYNMRNKLISSTELQEILGGMKPMFPPKEFEGIKRAKSGKYTYSEDERINIFGFIISEIRKHSNCKIALCKESASVWHKLDLPLSKCSCVCQLDYIDMEAKG